MVAQWVEACGTDEVDEEDVIRFDHDRADFCNLPLARR
jgi:hypothetical protein